MRVIQTIKPNSVVRTSYDLYQTFTTSAISTDKNRYVFVDPSQIEDIEIEENGKYSVFDVANWFLTKEPMTHKKLQKLCYYAQAWGYALNRIRLEDTDYQAWTHGPVSPVLWEKFKSFGFDTIRLKGRFVSTFEKSDIKLLEDIWETYGNNTGNALEALTHRELPWIEARRGYSPTERCSVVISPKTMESYYKSIYCSD